MPRLSRRFDRAVTPKLATGKQNNQRRHILTLNYVFTKQNIHEVLLKALEFCEYHTHSDSGQMQCILKSLCFRFRILCLVASVVNITLIHIQLQENTGKILIYATNSMCTQKIIEVCPVPLPDDNRETGCPEDGTGGIPGWFGIQVYD